MDSGRFALERTRTRRFFNLVSFLYLLVEGHLRPQYRDVLAHLALPPTPRQKTVKTVN